MRLPLALGLCLGITLAVHGKARLIEDINRTPDPGSIHLTWAESTGKNVVFSSYSPKTGQELWVAGAGGKPRLLKDIRPGPLDSYPSLGMALGDVVFFSADDGIHGDELWYSDGTAKGTRMVADLTPGPAGTNPLPYLAGAGHLFFTTYSDFGQELWASDGSAAGTVQLNPPSGGPESPRLFEKFGNLCSDEENAYFMVESANGFAIWRSDGSFAGTQALQELDSEVGFITDMMVAGEKLFMMTYQVSELDEYQELWAMSKEGGAAVRLAPAAGELAWSLASTPVPLGDRVFFTTNGELWASDGTSDGTGKLPMIHGGIERTQVGSIVTWRGEAYVNAAVGDSNSELWKSDGTAAGTVLVREGLSPIGTWNMQAVGRDGPFLCLDVPKSESESILWRTDGTTAGSQPLMTAGTGSLSYGPFGGFAGNDLFFLAAKDPGSERQLWRTNGTAASTKQIPRKRYRATLSATLQAAPISLGDGRVIFGPTVVDDEKELWVSNGSTKGTRPILVPSASTANFGGISPQVALGSEAIFLLATTEGNQLWITDGSGRGTRILKDLTADAEGYPTEFVAVGGTAFFVMRSADSRSLWRTDGTAAGTMELPSADGTPISPELNGLAEFQGRLYCIAGTEVGGARALWESDGTAAGTRMVGEVSPPGSTDKFRLLTRTNGRLNFFASSKSGKYHRLWTSDGTAEGTVPVKGINAELYTAASLGDLLVFQVREWNGTQSDQIWYRSDGTEEGTFRFANVSEVGSLYHMDPSSKLYATVGGFLCYVVSTNDGDEELWKSDGTAAGTMRLKNIRPGTQGSYPRELSVIGDTLYFTADDGVHGNELWQSDGTEAGTRLVADLQRGPLGSSPWHIVGSGSKLYVHAKQQRFGGELHVIDLPRKP